MVDAWAREFDVYIDLYSFVFAGFETVLPFLRTNLSNISIGFLLVMYVYSVLDILYVF